MKTFFLPAVLLLLVVAALVGAHRLDLVRLPLGALAPTKHAQIVPFAIHYPPWDETPILDAAGEALIGRTLDRHQKLLHRADVYLTPRRPDNPYGREGSPYANDTLVRVSLEAVRGVRLISRTDLTRRRRAAETASEAIERCVAALLRSRTDPDLKDRPLSVMDNL